MMMYRISKYDHKYRVGAKYLRNEWTDYSDIGKVFENRVLTEQEYFFVEQNYISCIVNILQTAGIESLSVKALEEYTTVVWQNNQWLLIEDLSSIFRDCLRNKCWCRLENNNTYVHFGYDYYVYVGVDLPFEKVTEICQKHNLFCNVQHSPYCEMR